MSYWDNIVKDLLSLIYELLINIVDFALSLPILLVTFLETEYKSLSHFTLNLTKSPSSMSSQVSGLRCTHWLPPGLSQKNSQAVKLVQQIVHDSIKWDKGTLCGCLQKNIVVNSISRSVNGPIPTMNQLFAHVQQHLPRASEFTQDLAIPTHVVVRFAYLRLATIIFVCSGSNARAAAWGPIDRLLNFRVADNKDQEGGQTH
ncbi:hypothetical protein VP01_426g1 [Puccinia sorghi]|uniref:Uncharacterized protein n=1 Tax=Puccinia sorghi TaxID=27349 RepID=A0A0L6UR59_9BASI|nr:hypothetical protein VP01_426g1 [Puccinia sorghi]